MPGAEFILWVSVKVGDCEIWWLWNLEC